MCDELYFPVPCDFDVSSCIDRAMIRYWRPPHHLGPGDDESLYGVSEECYDCFLRPLLSPPPIGDTGCILFQTTHAMKLGNGTSASDSFHFGEHGVYNLTVGGGSLVVSELVAPLGWRTYLPLIVSAGVLAALSLFFVAVLPTLLAGYQNLVFRWRRRNKEQASDLEDFDLDINALLTSPLQEDANNLQQGGEQEPSSVVKQVDSSAKPGRVQALDTFRGLSLIIMVFVNYGGGGYWFLEHSKWNGLTVADLVFPWFMWIMGTSMAFATHSVWKRKTDLVTAIKDTLFRAAKLMALGLFLNNGHDYHSWRIPGVLQYFGFAYGWIGVSHFLCNWLWRDNPHTRDRNMRVMLRVPVPGEGRFDGDGSHLNVLCDVTPFWREWIVSFLLPMSIWLCITFGLPVDGCPTGYLGPGGPLTDHVNCTGGSHRIVDDRVFGERHIYGSPSCSQLYETTLPYDPEGLTGAFNAVAMCFLGLQAGRVLLYHQFHTPRARAHRQVVLRWLLWGVSCLVLAGVLCGFQQNGGAIPVNKNLWSTSFILVQAGGGFVLLALLYVIVDVKGWWPGAGAPLRYVGMNSILIYVSHELLADYFPFSFDHDSSHCGAMTSNGVGTLCWVAVATILFHKKVFVTV